MHGTKITQKEAPHTIELLLQRRFLSHANLCTIIRQSFMFIGTVQASFASRLYKFKLLIIFISERSLILNTNTLQKIKCFLFEWEVANFMIHTRRAERSTGQQILFC